MLSASPDGKICRADGCDRVVCYPARGEENAPDWLAAALAGENPPACGCLDDFTVPVIRLALPTPARL